MKRINLLLAITFAHFFSLSLFGQTGINPPEGIKQHLDLSQGQSPSISEINSAYYSIPDSIDGDLNKEYIKSQRWLRYVFGKYNVYDSVTFDLTPYSNAVKAIYDSPLHCDGSDPASWTSEGPRYIPDGNFGQFGGWTNSIYGDPDDTTRMLIGTNTSGIFKTEDEGDSWVNVTDDMDYPVLGVNQIISAPNNEDYLLATTGTLFIDGGLIYSNDRGDSWNSFTSETPFLNWIDYHPTKNGCLFGVGEEKAFFSNDYGASWQNIGLPDSLNPLYMNFYKIIVLEDRLIFAVDYEFGKLTEFYEAEFTIDGTNNLSLTWNDERLNENFKSSMNEQLYFVDFSNKLDNKFYMQVLLCDTSISGCTPYNKLYESFDNGETYDYLDQANIVGNLGYTSYNPNYGRVLKSVLIASQNDTSIVYWGSVARPFRSNVYNGNYKQLLTNSTNNGHHDDYRSIYVLNNNGKDRILFGNDGGPALVRNGLNSDPEISSLNGDLSINLIHAFHIHEPTKRITYGFQDHYMRYRDPDNSYSGDFIHEGSAAMIQDRYPKGIVGESAYGSIRDAWFSTNDIVQLGFANRRLSLGAYFVNYRHYPERFARGIRENDNYGYYNGGVALNRGKLWSEVSEIDSSSSIGAVAICQRAPNYIYAAEFNIRKSVQSGGVHKFFRSDDDGQTWNYLTSSTVTLNNDTYNLSQQLEWNGIRAIAVDHTDPSVVYCGIGQTHKLDDVITDERFRVIKSTDYGNSFDDYSEGLPALPVERLLTVESDENLIFCATSVGIYYRMDGMSQWECFSENLPMVEITGMQYDYCAKELYVSTYGRGMWKTPVPFDISSSYQTEITGTETWNDFKILKEDLVIKDGGTLTITDTVRVAYDKKIIVEPGGRLNVNGGVLTNYCNDFWNGIEVWGDYQETQTLANQGFLQLTNDAVIENARTAIRVWKPGDWSSMGGIVQAYGTTFKNNWRSVEYMPYHDFNTNAIEINNRGLFSDCEFIWDDDYEDIFDTDIRPAITLYDVFGVRIKGCDFIDNRTYISSFEDRATAIKSLDATYRVTGRRLDLQNVNDPSSTHEEYDSTDFDISNFVNLYKGVSAMNSNSQSVVTVDHCKFLNSRIGVDIRCLNNALITRNYFNFDENHFSEIPKMNHIFLTESSGYQIEGNSFNNQELGETSEGTIISNSGIEQNQVYRNEYNDTYTANWAFGVNTNDDPFISKGLQWLCNEYNDYRSDQRSFGSTTFGDLKGIRLKQGLPFEPAGNTFTQALEAPFDDNHHFRSSDADEIEYFAYQNNSDEIPTELIGNIEVILETEQNECTSNFGTPIIGVSVANLLKDDVKTDLELELNDVNTSLANQKDALNDSLDQANTSVLYTAVQNLDTTSWSGLKEDLEDVSPFLTTDLIETLGNQTNPHYPHDWFTELILLNPEVAQSAEFMAYLLEKPEPLPQSYYDQIEVTRYRTISTRGEMINEIIALDTRSTEIVDLLLKNELSDTTEVDWDNFNDYQLIRNDEMVLQQVADQLFGNKKLSEASNALSHAADYVGESHYEYVNDNMYSYVKVKGYIRDTLMNEDGVIEGLDSTQVTQLIQLRDQYEGYLGGAQASNLLCFHANICEDIPSMEEFENKSMFNSNTPQKTISAQEDEVDLLLIPNPNEGTFVVKTTDRENIKDVNVLSLDGKQLGFDVVIQKDQAQVQLKNVHKGIYYIQVVKENKQQLVKKFVVY